MEKLKMHTPNLADENYKKLAALFPNAVTEVIVGYEPELDENGQEKVGFDGKVVMKPIVERAIDKDVLMQEISAHVVEGREERYQFTWPDKKKVMLAANAPISATLRPVLSECLNKDGKPEILNGGGYGVGDSENLYIEGDNLDVLKLLQETYIGRVQVIYIDPPYNTGHDFIYEDDFSEDTVSYMNRNGQFDDQGNRLEQNTESNGRFHTDWLNMIYSRIKLAKNLLADDGIIFISIDDNEYVNLTKICDEVFGISNRIGPIIQNKQNAKNDTVNIQRNHEFILVYRKRAILNGTIISPTIIRKTVSYKDVLEENGEYYYLNDPITTRGEGGTLNARPNLGYTVYYQPEIRDIIAVADYDVTLARTSNEESEIYTTDTDLISKGYVAIRPPKVRGKLGCWTWELQRFNACKHEIVITGRPGSYAVRKRTFIDKSKVEMHEGKQQYPVVSETNSRSIVDFSTNDGTITLNNLMGDVALFNNPKNLEMLKYFISLFQTKDALILDFFSGSATTAHAVMQLNAEDGGHRKFIMVQLPEVTDEKSEAYKAGYKNICEIGKERIRRAGRKIKEEAGMTAQDLDIGFRVLRLDSSNMQDVYYNPSVMTQTLLDMTTDNIKPDRTPEDLLFQVMLDLGVELSSTIQETTIDGKKVYAVAGTYLLACFDPGVTTDTVTAIAKQRPYYAVFRDSSMANDSVATNFDQIFETYSPGTVRRVL